MPTVLELKEQRAQLWERMKQINDGAEAENRNLTAEEDANWRRANTDIDDLDQRITRQERLERKPAPVNAPNQELKGAWREHARNPRALIQTPEYETAFDTMLRTPRAIDIDAETRAILAAGFVVPESRAMSVSSPTGGGYLAPDSFLNRIEQARLRFGGMREVSTILITSDGNDMQMPTSDDTSNTGEILAEGAAASEQDVTVGIRVLKAFMYSSKIIRASYQFLQDSAIDVEGWLAGRIAERIERATNAHFTTGVGANQPSGLAGDSTQGVAGATGQSTSVTWDDLITLEHSVDPEYRLGARYMFHDNTLREIRKLKDGEGRYLWQPASPITQAPNVINGYPYTVNQQVAQMAASATSIFFGALNKYHIRDVRGLTIMRLEERYAEYMQVGFLGFSRHDGVLLDAGTRPVKHYSNSAT